MEILAIIGIILLIVLLYVGGGLLGWVFKGLGAVLDFLSEGWGSCLRVLIWIFLIIFFLLGLFY